MRTVLIAVAALLLGVPAQAETLRIGYQKTGVLVVVKQQQRLEQALAPDSVKWVEFQAGPPLMEALNAGAIDIGYTGDSPPVFAQAGGVDLVYIAGQPISGANAGIVVHRDSDLHSVADLRGKRLALTKGSSAHYNAVNILKTANLTLADVKIAYLQPADARAAFRAGSVDGWVIWDPFFAAAERDPDARTLTNAAAAPSNTFLIAGRGFAAGHAGLILRLLAAVDTTALWAEQHPDELARAMAAATGVDLDVQRVASARGSYRYLLMDDAIVAQQQRVADTFAGLHVIPAKVDIRAAVWTPPAGTPIPSAILTRATP